MRPKQLGRWSAVLIIAIGVLVLVGASNAQPVGAQAACEVNGTAVDCGSRNIVEAHLPFCGFPHWHGELNGVGDPNPGGCGHGAVTLNGQPFPSTATAAPTSRAGTFDRATPNLGVNTAVWNGGTVGELATAVAAAGGISVTVFINGEATVLIPGAPAFVNAAFNAAYPGGNVPAGTIVLIVR